MVGDDPKMTSGWPKMAQDCTPGGSKVVFSYGFSYIFVHKPKSPKVRRKIGRKFVGRSAEVEVWPGEEPLKPKSKPADGIVRPKRPQEGPRRPRVSQKPRGLVRKFKLRYS